MLSNRELVALLFSCSLVTRFATALPARLNSNASVLSQQTPPAPTPYAVVVNEAPIRRPLEHALPLSRTPQDRNEIKPCAAESSSRNTKNLDSTPYSPSILQSDPSIDVQLNLATGRVACAKPGTATEARMATAGEASATPGLASSLAATEVPLALHTPGAEQNVAASLPYLRTPSYSALHVVGYPRNLHNGRQMSSSNQDQSQAVTSTNARQTITDSSVGDGINRMLTAFDVVATRSRANEASITAAPTQTQNALSVLLSALPTSVVESIESEYSITFPDESTATSSINTPSSSRTRTTRSSSSATRPTHTSSSKRTRTRTSSVTSTSSIHTTTESSSSMIPTSSTSSSTTLSTSTTPIPAASVTTTPSSTSTPAPTGGRQISDGETAGIAVGVTAGVILIILAVVFLFRRRKQGKAPFSRPRGSAQSKEANRAYPEIAWLYDPAPSPPQSPQIAHQREESGESGAALLPQRPAMASVSPQMPGPYTDTPLLPPQMPIARNVSPTVSPNSSPGNSPRRSRVSATSSLSEGRRPLGAIFEERNLR